MILRVLCIAYLVAAFNVSAQGNLEPLGKLHIPIGKPNTVDALKTFFEAEGNYSPGLGSYGVCFWVWDDAAGNLWAPTMSEAACEHGLDGGSLLLPWTKWRAGNAVQVTTLTGQSGVSTDQGELQMVATRVTLKNTSGEKQSISLYAVVRPVGAAGGPIHAISVSNRDMILVDGQPALISSQPADNAGVLEEDHIGQAALRDQTPTGQKAESTSGNCSGVLKFRMALDSGQEKSLQFVSPVHPGRKVNGHHWDGKSAWAQLDLNLPYSDEGEI